MTIRISVVIPAYNEAEGLPRLLEDLEEARRRYGRGAEAVEVIVADNGSTDETVELALAAECRVIGVRPRIIAAVRNAGGRLARGTFLCFIDADTRVHPETFNALEEYFADGTRVVGVTGAAADRRSLPIDLTVLMLGGVSMLIGYGVPRSLAECLPAGVVCCRRADWETIGGYDDRLRFAEDIRLLLDLRKLGRKRGQTSGWLRGAPAVFSTRKFDRHGDWHCFTQPLSAAARLLVSRRAFHRKIDEYWYGAQRAPERACTPQGGDFEAQCGAFEPQSADFESQAGGFEPVRAAT